MSLRHALTRIPNVDPNDAICISLATDSISPNRGNLMSVNFASLEEAPACILLRGADAKKAFRFTGVKPSVYEAKAVGDGRFVEIVGTMFQDAPFLVGYRVDGFLRPWLKAKHPALFDACCIVDILSLARYRESNQPYPIACKNIQDFEETIEMGVAGMGGYGYTMDALAHRYQPPGVVVEGPNLMQNKITNLWTVWKSMLEM
jgi:hypothetical protein